MYIIGAGMAGLLAANVFRKHNPRIIEAQSCLPNNHHAVLRHRDSKISEATSIPFKKVRVMKAINDHGTMTTTVTPRIANEYSLKTTGKLLNRSISSIEPVTRYIAPPDFVNRLALGCKIEYGINFDVTKIPEIENTPIISTIPMPVLWSMVSPETCPDFPYRPIETFVAYIDDVDCDLYQTIYYNNPKLGLYRMSITGNKVMAEFAFDDYSDGAVLKERHGIATVQQYLNHFLERDFGINSPLGWLHTINRYGKISPIDNTMRKKFIYEMTQTYNIYSLGRFATWRNILLDDVYDDLAIISKLMAQRAF